MKTPREKLQEGLTQNTTTYGDGSTWPWWIHVTPDTDPHTTPDAAMRYSLGLSDDALDVALRAGWEGKAGDPEGFPHKECRDAAWRLHQAIITREDMKRDVRVVKEDETAVLLYLPLTYATEFDENEMAAIISKAAEKKKEERRALVRRLRRERLPEES